MREPRRTRARIHMRHHTSAAMGLPPSYAARHRSLPEKGRQRLAKFVVQPPSPSMRLQQQLTQPTKAQSPRTFLEVDSESRNFFSFVEFLFFFRDRVGYHELNGETSPAGTEEQQVRAILPYCLFCHHTFDRDHLRRRCANEHPSIVIIVEGAGEHGWNPDPALLLDHLLGGQMNGSFEAAAAFALCLVGKMADRSTLPTGMLRKQVLVTTRTFAAARAPTRHLRWFHIPRERLAPCEGN